MRPTLVAVTVSIGLAACSPGAGSSSVDAGTWYHDVLPIVQAHCQQCHVPGGIAPFALLTYDDGYQQSTRMATAVSSRLMPPWKPNPACQSFQDARTLDQAQIDTIVNWADAGAPEGNPADAPPPVDAGLPGLPRIDAELDAGVDYTPTTANGPDDYHCLVLDPGLTQDTYITGVNLRPGVPSEVHHVILYDATATQVQTAQANQPGPGWTCFGGPGTGSTNMLGGWVPGAPAQVFPPNTGILLKAGHQIVMQVHYNLANGPPTPDRTVAQLMYSPTVAHPAVIGGPINYTFSIPPNSTGYSSSLTWNAPATATGAPWTVWGTQPHMHVKGQRINLSMGNGSACLIDIPQWDFHWQQMYFYQTPVQVPVGTPITLTCTWNNPTPAAVTFGEGTADEMCLNFFYATQ